MCRHEEGGKKHLWCIQEGDRWELELLTWQLKHMPLSDYLPSPMREEEEEPQAQQGESQAQLMEVEEGEFKLDLKGDREMQAYALI